MGKDPGRIWAVSASHSGGSESSETETPDQRRRNEEDHRRHQEALAVSQSSQAGLHSHEESRPTYEEGRCQKGSGEGSQKDGEEEECAREESRREEAHSEESSPVCCTGDDGTGRSVVRLSMLAFRRNDDAEAQYTGSSRRCRQP